MHAYKKAKSSSWDLITALDGRLSRIELAVSEMRDKLDEYEEHMEELNLKDEV